jgi:hypothetical protein
MAVVFFWRAMRTAECIWICYGRTFLIVIPADAEGLALRTSPLTDALGMIGRYAPFVGFIATFTGVRLNRWVRGYQILLLAIPVLFGFPFLSEKFAWLPRLSHGAFEVILLVVQAPFVVGALGFLGWKWRRGNREAGLLLPSFLLGSAFEVVGIAIPAFRSFSAGRFGFSYDDLSMFFFLASIAPVLFFRHRRIRLEQGIIRAIGRL